MHDNMYYVREKDAGVAGMELLDGMAKVEKMLKQYEKEKVVSVTVISRNSQLPLGINTPAVEEQVPISEIGVPIVYAVDDEGVLIPSQECILRCFILRPNRATM